MGWLKNKIREPHNSDMNWNDDYVMQFLHALSSVGLPDVFMANDFDTLGDDMMIDFRLNNYGPGRRILIEIAFNWGQ